jgi:hypothetical protein|tara:strand:- start:204 stop:536 length:333 start_codon:yes stop_codon:yes gene_type:complete
MKIFELFDHVEEASRGVFARDRRGGNTTKIKRKFRCTSGPRKGRVVADPATCNKPIDIQRRINAKRTRKQRGGQAAVKRASTMRTSPVTKILKKVNPLRRSKARKIKGLR